MDRIVRSRAAGSHAMARARELAIADSGVVALNVFVYIVLRYPKRLIFRIPSLLLGATWLVLAIVSWREVIHGNLLWPAIAAISAMARALAYM